MSVDQDTVRRIAKLARIAVSEEALTPLSQELSNILSFVEQLNELDTEGVAPMTSAVHMPLKMREDGVTDGDKVDDIIRNAPGGEDGFFVVPKVVE